MIHWLYRHWFPALLAVAMLAFLNFERETLRVVATIAIYFCTTLVLAGLGVFAFTSVNFIQERDTNAIAKIFLGTCLLVGLIVAGVQFTQYR